MKKSIITLGLGLALVLGIASCNKDNSNNTKINDDYKLKVVCPAGAPIVGIAEAIGNYKDNVDTENVGVAANTLAGFFQAGKSDVIVAPINAGVKLYNANKSTYKLASVLTWGNTYFASQKTTFELNDINDSDITLFGEDSITARQALYVLEQKGITPKSVEYKVDGAETNKELNKDATKIVMTAEPALSATRLTKEVKSYSISDLYKEITNLDMPQAAVFVSPDAIKNHKELLDLFLTEIDNTDELYKTDATKVAKDAIALGLQAPEAALANSISNCKVSYKKASTVKTEINKLVELFTSDFAKVPADEIYY